MKKIKICCAALLLLCFSVLTAAAADKPFEMSFIANVSDTSCQFNVWKSYRENDENYYIALPFDLKNENLSLVTSDNIIIDGKMMKDGDIIGPVSEGSHSVVCNDQQYTLNVMYTSDIPTIHITTESGNLEYVHADKENKESGHISIIDGENVLYSGGLDSIKGRGNSTWAMKKKPYNIKLDEKVELFGMEKNKSWSLLADYEDMTGVKNKLTVDYSKIMGMQFGSQSEKVDLFINGNYMGLYTLIEKVEIDKGRVDITDLQSRTEDANEGIDIEECALEGIRRKTIPNSQKYVNIPNNPADITGGYLLEYDFVDRFHDEISGFITNYTTPIVVKSPEYASKQQVEYIASYYQMFEDGVRSADGCSPEGKHYSEYMDMDTVAVSYLINELAKNRDSGLSSAYIYKDAGDKMYMGPLWDYDLAFGIEGEQFGDRNGISLSDPEGLLVSELKVNNETNYTVFALLNQRPEFRDLLRKIWQENIYPQMEEFLEEYDELTDLTQDSAYANAIMWTDAEKIADKSTDQLYEDEIKRVREYIVNRTEYLNTIFGTQYNYICYNANGGSGEMMDSQWYADGQTATVLENKFTNENSDDAFLGWNTQADGSGISYNPGAEIEMEEDVVLYAQWQQPSLFFRILSFIKTLFN